MGMKGGSFSVEMNMDNCKVLLVESCMRSVDGWLWVVVDL